MWKIDEGDDQVADEEDWEYFDEPLPPGWIINKDNWVVKAPILKPGDEGYYGPADGIAEEYERAQKKRKTSPEWPLPTEEDTISRYNTRSSKEPEVCLVVQPYNQEQEVTNS